MVLRDFFIELSGNELLSNSAQKYGLKLGAQSVVAGTNITEIMMRIKELNANGISVTVNNLGEFISDEAVATKAKEEILN